MRQQSFAIIAALAAAGLAASTHAATIVTFADPAMGPSEPLFEVNTSTNILTGSWTASGLTLQTPGLAAADLVDAQFVMSAVAILSPLPSATLGPGQIDFWDSSSVLQMTITFSGGLLSSSFGFGSSEFQGNNVTFSGPLLGGTILTQEAFGFSFANPSSTPSGYRASASFTSSATVVPAPAGLAALGMACMGIARRRRR